MHGVYFALKQLLNEQPPNATKTAFGPNENCDPPAATMSIHHVRPIEMLTNCLGGSVRGYAEGPSVVTAQRIQDEMEDAIFERFTRHFQAGVLSAVDVISEWVRVHALTSADLRPHALAQLHELTCDPPRALAQAYFEQFGLGQYVHSQRPFPWLLACTGLVSRKQRGAFVRFLDDTGWPQGFLRYHNVGLLCGVYNRAVHARRARG